jgi:hypothetical protein
LGIDKANLVAALGWAGSRGRWLDAGRLLLGSFSVFYADPIQGIELADRCIGHLPSDDDLAQRLVINQFWLFQQIADFDRATAVRSSMSASSDPLTQVWGFLLSVNGLGLIDNDRASQLLDQAAEIQRLIPVGDDATQTAAAWEVFSALTAM